MVSGGVDEKGGAGRTPVLVAIPEPLLAGELAKALAAAGFLPCLAFGRHQLATSLEMNRFRVLVLHSSLIDTDLVRLARTSRGDACLPIIVVSDATGSDASATGHDVDLELPEIAVYEVVESVAALAQLAGHTELSASIGWGPLRLDLRRRQAEWDEGPLSLTPLQFRIMEVLILAAGAVVRPADLSRRVWGPAAFNDGGRIEAHIRRIRKKLHHDASGRGFLLTVRGEGYRLAEYDLNEPAIDLTELELIDA